MELFHKANIDRGKDNWLAIDITAKRISSGWMQRAQAALTALEARQSDDTQSAVVQLLSDVRTILMMPATVQSGPRLILIMQWLMILKLTG